MKKELELFIETIADFDEAKSSDQINYFAYFLSEQQGDGFRATEIQTCFDLLNLPPYSNIPSFLSKKSKAKEKNYIKKKDKYFLSRNFQQTLKGQIGNIELPSTVHSEYFPIELFDNTRGYLKQLANQALACYNNAIYDGCSVLMRKLVEILIIECFEKFKIENSIKKADGSFFHLRDLITEFLKEPKWNIGRNAKQGLPKIKKVGDQSAHNRRFIARKLDLDSIKDDLRVVVEELIHLIDYPELNKK